MSEQLGIINYYFKLVQEFNTDPAAYATVLHPEIEQVEYPNPLYPTLQRRSFHDILSNLRVGRELLRDQSFDVSHTHLCFDGRVIVEGRWEATLVSAVRGLAEGQRIAAQLCLVFEFKDGKIYRQQRYPCFEQF